MCEIRHRTMNRMCRKGATCGASSVNQALKIVAIKIAGTDDYEWDMFHTHGVHFPPAEVRVAASPVQQPGRRQQQQQPPRHHARPKALSKNLRIATLERNFRRQRNRHVLHHSESAPAIGSSDAGFHGNQDFARTGCSGGFGERAASSLPNSPKQTTPERNLSTQRVLNASSTEGTSTLTDTRQDQFDSPGFNTPVTAKLRTDRRRRAARPPASPRRKLQMPSPESASENKSAAGDENWEMCERIAAKCSPRPDGNISPYTLYFGHGDTTDSETTKLRGATKPHTAVPQETVTEDSHKPQTFPRRPQVPGTRTRCSLPASKQCGTCLSAEMQRQRFLALKTEFAAETWLSRTCDESRSESTPPQSPDAKRPGPQQPSPGKPKKTPSPMKRLLNKFRKASGQVRDSNWMDLL